MRPFVIGILAALPLSLAPAAAEEPAATATAAATPTARPEPSVKLPAMSTVASAEMLKSPPAPPSTPAGFCPQFAPVQFDQAAGEGQTQAGTFCLFGTGIFGAVERQEHALSLVC